MRIFSCQNCSQVTLYENTHCESCQSKLGFLPEILELSSLQPSGGAWLADADPTTPKRKWYYCANNGHGVCNWLVAKKGRLCLACELNRHIPNQGAPEQREAWQKLEFAKHRLVYSLLRLKLPLRSKRESPEDGLGFDFISEDNAIPSNAQTMTGHASGRVTINAQEAVSSEREATREQMNESYRTLLGHFRHEVGHYYWDLLIAKHEDRLTEFRQLFGDERLDYEEALASHYQNESSAWRDNYISAYAAAHPWEDWAETWAHYLHIVDTLETAAEFGLHLQPKNSHATSLAVKVDTDPYNERDFDTLIHQSIPLTFAINSINRSMGQPDLYPFVLGPSVKAKLAFIHSVLLEVRE